MVSCYSGFRSNPSLMRHFAAINPDDNRFSSPLTIFYDETLNDHEKAKLLLQSCLELYENNRNQINNMGNQIISVTTKVISSNKALLDATTKLSEKKQALKSSNE
jgi:Flp pilus assembly protein TadD